MTTQIGYLSRIQTRAPILLLPLQSASERARPYATDRLLVSNTATSRAYADAAYLAHASF
jgi:hypothetical protein